MMKEGSMGCHHITMKFGYCTHCGIQPTQSKKVNIFEKTSAVAEVPLTTSIINDAKSFKVISKSSSHDINEETGKCNRCKLYWKNAGMMCAA